MNRDHDALSTGSAVVVGRNPETIIAYGVVDVSVPAWEH